MNIAKKVSLGLAVTLTAFGLVACEGNGEMSASNDGARDATYGTNESMTVPAVNTVTGGTATIGEQAPNFTLTDLDGKTHTLSEYTEKGKIVVLEWFNPKCPYVVKHYARDTQTMNELASMYEGDDVVWLAINSGAPGLQGAGKELNREYAQQWNINHPILIDETGNIGKAYGARTTPEMYVINSDGVLVYHGAIDNNSSPTTFGDVNYVKDAIEATLDGRMPSTKETRSYGCSVKYGA